MAKRNLLIYGAGAIGRGYLPWVFTPQDYDFYYVEADPGLRGLLQARGAFTSHMTAAEGYRSQEIAIAGCCAPGEEAPWRAQADAMVTAVGPRNFLQLQAAIRDFAGPVLCCENDARLPAQMRQLTGHEGVVFAIPDVIVSNTASRDLLAQDPLSLITENGECFIHDRVSPQLPGRGRYVDEQELQHQWLAKLYVHNTPHCIAAYLGSLRGLAYLHEAMADARIAAVVQGAMDEMVAMLRVRSDVRHEFLAFYRDKELARFRNPWLFDPIARVAREPFRKLHPQDRLLGAAQRCLAAGVVPSHLLVGIVAAFCFDRPEDPDAHIRHLRRSMKPRDILQTVFKLQDSEALFMLLCERWPAILAQLEGLAHG